MTAGEQPEGQPDKQHGAPRRAIVVGASSGIGAALVRRLAREGSAVAAVARRVPELEELARACAAESGSRGGRVLVESHDVLQVEEVPARLGRLAESLGGLDLLVYAAGILLPVGRDEYDATKDLAMLRVNLGGMIAWGNAAASFFQKQRAGTIVGLSSVAGDRGRKLRPAYGASKAGMNAYLESLRHRLHDAGVHVCTIRAGHVETAMTRGIRAVWPIGPDRAAELVLAAVRDRAAVRYVPRRWAAVGLFLRLSPEFLVRRMEF